MPGDTADIGARGWVGEHGEGGVRLVAIMVPAEYFGFGRRPTQGRPEMVLYERGLLGGVHDHAGIVLWVMRFVLRGYGADMNAMATHCLDIFHEIAGVGRVIFRL